MVTKGVRGGHRFKGAWALPVATQWLPLQALGVGLKILVYCPPRSS